MTVVYLGRTRFLLFIHFTFCDYGVTFSFCEVKIGIHRDVSRNVRVFVMLRNEKR
jgi:hypothetical protein